MRDDDLLDPARLIELDLSPGRLREVARAFEAIRRETERRRALDARGERPAVVRRRSPSASREGGALNVGEAS